MGEGADEILLGYHLYKAVRAQEWLTGGHEFTPDDHLLRRVLRGLGRLDLVVDLRGRTADDGAPSADMALSTTSFKRT